MQEVRAAEPRCGNLVDRAFANHDVRLCTLTPLIVAIPTTTTNGIAFQSIAWGERAAGNAGPGLCPETIPRQGIPGVCPPVERWDMIRDFFYQSPIRIA